MREGEKGEEGIRVTVSSRSFVWIKLHEPVVDLWIRWIPSTKHEWSHGPVFLLYWRAGCRLGCWRGERRCPQQAERCKKGEQNGRLHLVWVRTESQSPMVVVLGG